MDYWKLWTFILYTGFCHQWLINIKSESNLSKSYFTYQLHTYTLNIQSSSHELICILKWQIKININIYVLKSVSVLKIFFRFLNFILCIWVFWLPASIYVGDVYAWFLQSQKRMPGPLNQSYRQLWTNMWLLGTEPRSSTRAECALLPTEPSLQPSASVSNLVSPYDQYEFFKCSKWRPVIGSLWL